MIFPALLLGGGFLGTVLLGTMWLPFFKRARVGQSIRPEGPDSHYSKKGTPTMGGMVILIVLFLSAIFFLPLSQPMKYILYLVGSFGLIGGIDDALKLVRNQNEGLTTRQKFLAQVAIGAAFAVLLVQSNFHLTQGPTLAAWGLNRSIPFGIFTVFVVVGSANAANLTDGLDGLAGGLLGMAVLVFAFLLANDPSGLYHWLLIWAGAIFGFLWFNLFPAKWFMGDIGSLALGAGLAGIALTTNQILPLIVITLPMIAETVSVMLQVSYFKMTRKRLFRMSPLHHHFELGGLSEVQVVRRFWATGLICALVTLAIMSG